MLFFTARVFFSRSSIIIYYIFTSFFPQDSVSSSSTSPECGDLRTSKRKLAADDDSAAIKIGGGGSDVKKAKLETKALKAKRPGFTDERYNETSYYHEPEFGLRKVYPYYFTFTTFTKGRWVGEKILDVFAREFRAHPAEEYVSTVETAHSVFRDNRVLSLMNVVGNESFIGLPQSVTTAEIFQAIFKSNA